VLGKVGFLRAREEWRNKKSEEKRRWVFDFRKKNEPEEGRERRIDRIVRKTNGIPNLQIYLHIIHMGTF
jgi:hypothetical protein